MKYSCLYGLVCLLLCGAYITATPLDDYVFAPDPNYGYQLIQTYVMKGYTLYIYNFTSQKWLDESFSNRPIWWHYLCITVPDKITKPDTAFLLIDGGSNTDGMPKPTDNFVELTSVFAVSTGSIGADLQQIPNQPVIFKTDPSQRKRDEDAVIAWTWKTFVENQTNPYVLLRMPMTKASVRAMDAVTEIAANKFSTNITKFMIAGASKRGWTTWTTAAVDNKRVVAAVPIVMDLLNLNANLHHHYRSLGGWTFAFNDYYDVNITKYMDTPQLQAMANIVDPISYLDRYANTKLLLVNSAGDEFFIPDDSNYFWNNLLAATNGSVMVRRLPDAEHSCAGHEISIFFSMRSFYLSHYYNLKYPKMTWTRPNNDTHGITILTIDTVNGPTPYDVDVFHAQTLSNQRRDFRLVIGNPYNPNKPLPQPVIWTSAKSLIQTQVTNTSIIYTVAFRKPIAGWSAFYYQASFAGPEDTDLQISSEVNIIPEEFPFPDCSKDSCYGTLV